MSQYVPRDYQSAAIDAVFDEFAKGVKSTLLVMATGVGKTAVYLQIIQRFLLENPGKRVLVAAHREELIMQPAKNWRENWDEWPAIEMGELRAGYLDDNDLFDGTRTNDRLVIASIQTLNAGKRCANCTADCSTCARSGKVLVECEKCYGSGIYTPDGAEVGECFECNGSGQVKSRCNVCQGDGWICVEEDCPVCFEHFTRRMQKFQPDQFGLIIYDEAHHSVAGSYTRVIRYFRSGNPDIKIVGPTATPDRADEEALGQVYESVAYQYDLPQPIHDGWLVPIVQHIIHIEDLNLANIRTTAGDFNAGDLEREMLAEKVLHEVTTPLVEIACGLPMRTIDILVKENRIHDLLDLCTKREQALVHAVDVAHAERMTEIINRYLPDSALCITGRTAKNIRRDGLKKFENGDIQFLLSCGVFLEGTDLPNISIVAMARPTMSRALYGQMAGRMLRPFPGVVDGVATAEERVRRIAGSKKPVGKLIDFACNSGRHKLICSADILGGELPDELVEGVIRKAVQDGRPVDMLRELAAAKQRAEEEKRRRTRKEAQDREAQQEAAKRRATERRQGIVAGASWKSNEVNPFDVFDVSAKREPGWQKGRKPSDSMKDVLRKNKIPFNEETTFWEAHLLIDEIFKRRSEGKCTFSQAKWLQAHGYSPDTKFDECRRIMDAWSKNDWRRPPDAA